MLEKHSRLDIAKEVRIGDASSKKKFDDVFNLICKELEQLKDKIVKEKIHEIGELTIEFGKDRAHKIMLINSHPEINIENYAQKIQKVFTRAAEIHPVIVERIKHIIFSSEGKDLHNTEEKEEAIQSGLINGPNGTRIGSAVDIIILLKDRSFKNIIPRYRRDNPDIKSTEDLSHFEMILTHELFHELKNLSQYQMTVSGISSESKKNFYWMQVSDNIKSLNFNGFVSSKMRPFYLNKKGELEEKFRNITETMIVKNNDSQDVECIYFPENGTLIPRDDIIFPEKIITNYARAQMTVNTEEDFCDSMVVYAFDPEFLKEFDRKRKTSKFNLLEQRWGLYTEIQRMPNLKMNVCEK